MAARKFLTASLVLIAGVFIHASHISLAAPNDVVWLPGDLDAEKSPEQNWYLASGKMIRGRLVDLSYSYIDVLENGKDYPTRIDDTDVGDEINSNLQSILGEDYPVCVDTFRFLGGRPYFDTPARDRTLAGASIPGSCFIAIVDGRAIFMQPPQGQGKIKYVSVAISALTDDEIFRLYDVGSPMIGDRLMILTYRGETKRMQVQAQDDQSIFVYFQAGLTTLHKDFLDQTSKDRLAQVYSDHKLVDDMSNEKRKSSLFELMNRKGELTYIRPDLISMDGAKLEIQFSENEPRIPLDLSSFAASDLHILARRVTNISSDEIQSKKIVEAINNAAQQNRRLENLHPLRTWYTKNGWSKFKARLVRPLDENTVLMQSEEDVIFQLQTQKIAAESKKVLDEDLRMLDEVSPSNDPLLAIAAPQNFYKYGDEKYSAWPIWSPTHQPIADYHHGYVDDRLLGLCSNRTFGEDNLAARVIVDHNLSHPQDQWIESIYDLSQPQRDDAIRTQRILGYWHSLGIAKNNSWTNYTSYNVLKQSVAFAKVDDEFIVVGLDGKFCYIPETVLDPKQLERFNQTLITAESLVNEFGMPKGLLDWYSDGLQLFRPVHMGQDSFSLVKLIAISDGPKELVETRKYQGYATQTYSRVIDASDLTMLEIDAYVQRRSDEFKRECENLSLSEQANLLVEYRSEARKHVRLRKATGIAAAQAEGRKQDSAKMQPLVVEETDPQKDLELNSINLLKGIVGKAIRYQDVEAYENRFGKPHNSRANDSNQSKSLYLLAAPRGSFNPIYGEIVGYNDDGFLFRCEGSQKVAHLFRSQLNQNSLEKAESQQSPYVKPETFPTRFITTSGNAAINFEHEITTITENSLTFKLPLTGEHIIDRRYLNERFYEELLALSKRKAFGVVTDLDFDQKFLLSTDDSERLNVIPILDDIYAKALERIDFSQFGPPEKFNTNIVPGSSVATLLKTDRTGTRIILKPNKKNDTSIEVVELINGQLFKLPADIKSENIISFVADQPQIVAWKGNALVQWNYSSGAVDHEYDFKADQTAVTRGSGNCEYIVIALRNNQVWKIDPVKKKTVQVLLSESIENEKIRDLLTGYDASTLILRTDRMNLFHSFETAKSKISLLPNRSKSLFDRKNNLNGNSFGEASGLTIDFPNEERVQYRIFGEFVDWTGVPTDQGPQFRTLSNERDELAGFTELYICDLEMGQIGWIEGDWSVDACFSGNGQTIFYRVGEDLAYSKIGPYRFSYADEFEKVIVQMLSADDFGQIEAFARALRKIDHGSAIDFTDELYETYVDLVKQQTRRMDEIQGGDLTRRMFLRLRRWQERFPKSNVLRLIMAQHYVNLAWAARGSGFANQVSEDEWKVFQENIELAVQILRPAIAANDVDEALTTLTINIIKARKFDFANMMGLVGSAIRNNCGYSPTIHTAAAECLLPRWHGEQGQLEKYVLQASDKIGGKAGDRIYFRCVYQIAQYYPDPVLQYHNFDLDRASQGAIAAMEMNLDSYIVRQFLTVLERAKRDDLVEKILLARKEIGRVFEYYPLELSALRVTPIEPVKAK